MECTPLRAAIGIATKCQGNARLKWLEARSAELLPVQYFHFVFTLPHELSALALGNKRIIYDLLYRASDEAMLELARAPRHLGADIQPHLEICTEPTSSTSTVLFSRSLAPRTFADSSGHSSQANG
jgi:hypothetical protein